MNILANTPVEIAEQFVLRTPLLPFSALTAWGYGTTAASDPEDAARFVADWRCLGERLRALAERPEVRGALLVASPDLHTSLETWSASPDSPHGLKIQRALVRYVCRMSARATPFGLFAGVSSGTLGTHTNLRLRSRADYVRHTRLDNDYLFEVAEQLAATPALRAAVPLSVNSSLYVAAGRIRYVEARVSERARSHHLVSVAPTPYLHAALECARTGAKRTQVAAAVAEAHGDVDPEEAALFVDELIDSQLLVTDLAPPVTGPEPIHHIVRRASSVAETEPVADALRRTHATLASIDAEGLGAARSRYNEVAEILGSLPTPVPQSRLFQVDMVKPTECATLGKSVIAEIQRGIRALHRMTPPSRSPLRGFCDDFVARYGDAEVPLMVALDEEAGVGFESADTPGAEDPPLLAGLAFPAITPAPTTRWDRASAWLFERLCKALQRNERTLALTDDDVAKLSTADPPRLPDTFATTVQIAARSDSELEAGDFKVLISAGSGPPGSRLTGRFCHASASIQAGLAAHLRVEEAMNSAAIYAEIVHLPAGRVGNVLCRPVLREYEIPFLGISGAPHDRQIPVADLLVSVRDGRAVLHSRRLGRVIIPRLSAAHVFQARGLGIYRFLGALQGQDGEGFRWTWGALQSAPFLPRVEYGRLVLQRAQWRLGHEQIRSIAESIVGPKPANTTEQNIAVRHRSFQAVQALRHGLQLPRWVVLADSDNELTIDLDNALCVDSLAHLLKSRRTAVLLECFPNGDELIVEGPEGPFVHQISLSATCRNPPRPAPARAKPQRQPAAVMDPSWLYVKLYMGTATADEVLSRVVAPVCGKLAARGDADRWFFVRYGDPRWHLRVRIHGDPARLREAVMPTLQRAIDDARTAGLIFRAAFDSYEPEVERYGGPAALALSEEIFAADSVAVAAILAGLTGDERADARWRLAIVGSDWLMNDLGLSLAEKAELTTAAKTNLEREFGVGADFRRQLGTKFRTHRGELARLLNPAPAGGHGPREPGIAILKARTKVVQPLAIRLRAPATSLQRSLVSIASAHVHMHVNRMLRSAARAQELVIYDLLRRLHQSTIARARKPG